MSLLIARRIHYNKVTMIGIANVCPGGYKGQRYDILGERGHTFKIAHFLGREMHVNFFVPPSEAKKAVTAAPRN